MNAFKIKVRFTILVLLIIGMVGCKDSTLPIQLSHQQLFIAPLNAANTDVYHVLYVDFSDSRLYFGLIKQGSYAWGAFHSFNILDNTLYVELAANEAACIWLISEKSMRMEFWDGQCVEFKRLHDEEMKKEFLLELF